MAATITDNRTIIDEADATTNWTGSVTLSVVTTDPTPVEATGCLGQRNNATTTDAYRGSLTAINFKTGTAPGPSLIYVWCFPRTVPDTKVNGGIAIQLGDGTNRVAFHVGGIDESGFRHELGPTLWQCFVLDTAKAELASDGGGQYAMTTKAGTAASLDFTAITQIGYQIKATAAAQGNVPNTYVDIMRYGKAGQGLTITGTSGVLLDIVTADKDTATQKAFGVIRQLATGVYGLQGVLVIGDASGSANTSFSMTNETLVFPGFTISSNMYQIILQQGGSGSTSVTINGCTLYCPAGIGAKFDAGGAGTINLDIDATTFFGFSNGLLFKAGHTVNTTIISNCGTVTAPGTDLRYSSIISSLAAADTSALVWNVNQNTDGYLDSMTFTKGSAAHHAIELGASAPTSITLRGITFNGFNAANDQNDSTIHVKATGGTVTINVVSCSGNISYKSAGATVVIASNPVSATLTVKDTATPPNNIESAMVLAVATAGGSLPVDVTVTITNSGTTATVSHTSHGMASNDKVQIKGASLWQNNGVFTITKVNDNSYTYTMTEAPGSNPTGTIKATYVVLNGLTGSNGQITMSRSFTSSQPFSGRVRKSTSAPFFKTTDFIGTVDSTSGWTGTVQLIPDQ